MVLRVSIIERFHCRYTIAMDVGPMFYPYSGSIFQVHSISKNKVWGWGCVGGGVCVCDSGQGMELEVHCTGVVNFIMQNVM